MAGTAKRRARKLERPRFYVVPADEEDKQLVPDAAFAIHIQDPNGHCDAVAYIGSESDRIIRVIRYHGDSADVPENRWTIELPADAFVIPHAAIEAARRQTDHGGGQFLNSDGLPVPGGQGTDEADRTAG